MSTLEKLAIEHGSTCYTGQQYRFDKWQLEAFAKAYANSLQSSEPVAWWYEHWLDGTRVDIKTQKLDHYFYDVKGNYVKGVPLFTHPPASVPLKKYNKLLDALRFYDECKFFITHPDGRVELIDHGCVASKAIAEAELSEGKEG